VLYAPRPSSEEMQAVGVRPEDLVQDVDIWPENFEAVSLFLDMGTQWQTGMNGATGLRYEALWTPLRIRKVPRARWEEVFDGLRVMERAVLELKAEANNG
jgi:hypothetical protein